MKRTIQIAICGLGTVGGEVYRILRENNRLISRKIEAKVEVKKVFTKTGSRKSEFKVDPSLITQDFNQIINDPEIDIVIETIGDQEIAKTIIEESLKAKKQVVTANKAILCKYGRKLYPLSDKNRAGLFFEASVGGAIPVLKTLKESFSGDDIRSIHGIINGTANYILTQMESTGQEFGTILKEAQKLGYAESDPTADIEGFDTAHKLTILSCLAFKTIVPLRSITIDGISRVSLMDINSAHELGYKIKLLGISKNTPKGLDIRVHPTMIPEDHLLASVDGAFNAIMIQGKNAGPSMLYGLGAGGKPTANAMVGDIMAACRNILQSNMAISALGFDISLIKKNIIKPLSDLTSRYYLRLIAKDKPGVLAKITTILANNKVSLSSIHQPDDGIKNNEVPITIMTHLVKESHMMEAVKKINQLSVVIEKALLIRIEDFI